MISSPTIDVAPDALMPPYLARQVLTAGPEHINYRGGIGGVMNVYARYISPYKCVTSHKPTARKWQLIPFFLGQYARFIHTLRTDPVIRIVHLQASSYGSFYRKLVLFLTAKYAFGKLVIYHMHGSEFQVFYQKSDPVTRFMIHFLVERADLVICLSASWKAFFTKNFAVRRIEVLGNVIHKPVRQANDRALPQHPLRLLFLGYIGDRKGIFDLLEVIRDHKVSLAGRLELRVGGNGEIDRLTDYIARHELTDIVYFEGWVTGDRKAQLLAGSDVYILPSYNEGLPVAILEAMSYGLPIISTPVGGTGEAVIEGANGFLVPPGNKEAIHDRLMRFVEGPELVRHMGDESARQVGRYLPEAIFPALARIYERLLNDTGLGLPGQPDELSGRADVNLPAYHNDPKAAL